ncbi:MAG: hydrolase [Parachlamydiaceae bacterium]
MHNPSFTKILDWIDSQQHPMVTLLRSWAAINSASENLPGLARMIAALEMQFSSLQGEMSRIDLPPRTAIAIDGSHVTFPHGQALRIKKRPEAPVQVFLGGHMDTVYAPSHPFQSVDDLDANTLRGPGVADMKGGLIVMLTALKAFEQHPEAKKVGWEILINPDEEIGSVGSEKLFVEAAKRNDLGLIFEPSFSDGALVSDRKGSANFSVVATGRAAHAGRDFDRGRNAIAAIADFVVKASALCDSIKGISVNVGQILGGGPVNIVPDFALCRLNMRANRIEDFEEMQVALHRLTTQSPEGTTLTLHTHQKRGPKPFNIKCQELFDRINHCAGEEGYSLATRPSGGVCDGNILSEAGLPVIDSLGVIGGNLHTPDEYMLIDSLVQRSRLTARFLMTLK